MGGSREGISVPRKSVEDGHQYRVGRTGVPGWKNRSTFKRYSANELVDHRFGRVLVKQPILQSVDLPQFHLVGAGEA